MGNNKQTLIKKRRRLSALYERGVEVRFSESGFEIGPFIDENGEDTPPKDDEVQIWIQAPNPLQRQEALNESSAKRAIAMLRAKEDINSVDGASLELAVKSMETDELIAELLGIQEVDRQKRAIREVLSRDEWDDFDTLRDAMRQWEETGFEDTDEWDALKERDTEYSKQVSEVSKELYQSDHDALAMMPREELENRLKNKKVESIGSVAFVEEYEYQMLYFSCRDIDDHDQLFFESPLQVKEQNEVIQEGISIAVARFIEDGTEAKNSQRAEPSSQESEPPVKQETSESSTQEVVNA